MLFSVAACILVFGVASESSGEQDALSLMQRKSVMTSGEDEDFDDIDFDDSLDDGLDDESGGPIDKGSIDKSDCPWSCTSMTFGWGKKCSWPLCKPCNICEIYGKDLRCDKDCYTKNPHGEFRQPWTKKCPKAFCRGCDECASYTTTTTTVKLDPCWWQCIEMPYSWGKKCDWENCAKCKQCDAWAKNKQCKDTCYKGQKGWKEKCQRADCGTCSECEDLFKKEKDPDEISSTPAPTTTCEDSCKEQYDRLAEKERAELAKKKTCAKERCTGCDICQ